MKKILSIFNKRLLRRKRYQRRKVSSCSQTSNTTEARTVLTEPTSRCEIESSVRFRSIETTTRFTLSRNDYTPEEIKATWYQDEEYSKISKDCCTQIKEMENGEIFKDTQYCSRGLESHTKLATISKTQNRKNATDAVLAEQDEQRRLGVVDDEARIAHRYHQGTSSCQLWANTVGLRDQRAAERYIE
jgi:hypothetical protein